MNRLSMIREVEALMKKREYWRGWFPWLRPLTTLEAEEILWRRKAGY